ncbi:MAG: SCP2 sterol-binding domain-containing protein, partial [Firmicutes bacterium]|nr:SCP2 sterol-binding domain-containing protein [Bacillota bacterium]
MPFPYKDPRQAEDFIVEYLEATQTDPVLLDAWKRLGMVVGFKIEDLGLGFGLDCTSGDKVVISRRYPDPPPAAAMKLTSDTFHDIFTGRLNVGMAFMKRAVRTEGNIAGVLKLTGLMPRNIKVYKDLLAAKGLEGAGAGAA